VSLQVWLNYWKKSQKPLEDGISTEKADRIVHWSNLPQRWLPALIRPGKWAQSWLR